MPNSFYDDKLLKEKTKNSRADLIPKSTLDFLKKDDELSNSIIQIIQSQYKKWTGETHEEIEEGTTTRKKRKYTVAPLFLQFKVNTIDEVILFSYRMYSSNDYPEDLKFDEHENLYEINGWSKTLSLEFNEELELKDNFNKWIAKKKGHARLFAESLLLSETLEEHLNHLLFQEVPRAHTLKLNSPVLQRKEGYREILRTWLMFDLAAKLIWEGGDDIYDAGQKNIAVLYEYWLFFILLDLFEKRFHIEPREISKLIRETSDGLNLQVRQGKFTAMKGVFEEAGRKLNFRFNYNRSFKSDNPYPEGGSWTTTLRPDYTLSFWPYGIHEAQAEREEIIVHIHFDAKYKVAKLSDLINRDASEEDLNKEKRDNREGTYNNADLLKMHAYKDAIRRTGGAYVLYPGEAHENPLRSFHEIIPGLGAFSVKPSKTDNGTQQLEEFIDEVVRHFVNRTSQREKVAFGLYDIHKYPPSEDHYFSDALPEPYGENRSLLPDLTPIIVGFYESVETYDWIVNKKLYNFRTGTIRGSLPIDADTLNARYILLHTHGDKHSGRLWKISTKGAKIWTKEDLKRKGYPGSHDPGTYLMFTIEKAQSPELQHLTWDFRKLLKYKGGRASALPFTTTLTELMKCKVI